MTASGASPPWLLKYRSSNGFIVSTVCLAIFTDGFLYSFIVPVLPFILTERSGIPEHEVPYWTSSLLAVYGAAILIGSPIFGWLADQTSSRRWPLLMGLTILALATLMFAGGNNIWVLVASRMLQGFSAANVYTVGLALLVDTVGRDELGQMMGFALSSMSAGTLISPLLGGLVYAKAGYFPLFMMVLGLICFDILLRLVMIEKRVAAQYEPVGERYCYGAFQDGRSVQGDQSRSDITGVDDAAQSKCPAHVDEMPSSDAERWPLLQKDATWECTSKSRTPTMVIMLSSPRLMTAAFGMFVAIGILSSFDAVVPLFVKQTFGWDSLQAGLVFLCIAGPALTGALIGKLSDRYGPRRVAATGFLTLLPFLAMLGLVNHHSTAQIVLLCVLLSLIGLFLTFVMTPLAADLTYTVEVMEAEQPGIFGPYGAYAQVFALFTCSIAAGVLVFPAWAGVVQAKLGWKTLAWCMGLTCGFAAIPVIIFTGGAVTERSQLPASEGGHGAEASPV